jgi:hypothetical protein
MADRLSWLALVAALTFSVSVVMLGAGGKADETGSHPDTPSPACCEAAPLPT